MSKWSCLALTVDPHSHVIMSSHRKSVRRVIYGGLAVMVAVGVAGGLAVEDHDVPPMTSTEESCDYFWDTVVVDDRNDDDEFRQLADVTNSMDSELANDIMAVADRISEPDASERLRAVFERCMSLGWSPPSEAEMNELLRERR